MIFKHIIDLCFLFAMLLSSAVVGQAVSSGDIVWTTPSKNAGESMPCGGGDIGLNVWSENGDIMVYIARSGYFDEHNGLMKAGRLRIRLEPNPFAGDFFQQQLHTDQGYVSLRGRLGKVDAEIKIWVDVFRPVVQIEINSSQLLVARASYESWRYQDRVITARENFGNSWKWAAPKPNTIFKDSMQFSGNGVCFYHHNQEPTIFDHTVQQQGLGPVAGKMYNPLRNLAFGGLFAGSGMIPDGTTMGEYAGTDFKAWQLKSIKPQKKHVLNVFLHTEQTQDIARWRQSLDSVQAAFNKVKNSAWEQTKQWWQAYWLRSFINIEDGKPNPNAKATEVSSNYKLFRYMQALNAYGQWPTKFNGGLLTVDPCFTDSINKHLTPDYRNWGGGLHTMQNQRLVYYPMLKSGDFDLMQSQFDFYMRLQPTAELRSHTYWQHNGACFTEQMENFGLPNYAEYGQNRPEHFDKGVEYNAWLEYEWDTVLEFCQMMLDRGSYNGHSVEAYLPFIESCLRFFDEHYQYEAKQKGRQALDANGHLILYPGSGAETFKMAYNSTATIAALVTVTKKMLALPAALLGQERAQYLQTLQRRIPPIGYRQMNGHTTISPAWIWQRVNNTESPQMYPIFPWGMYGVGRPGIDTALNTWHYDTLVAKFRSHVGWKQDNIWAARLGLRDEAWRLTSLKLENSGRRFPAFWGPGFDWVPDFNWGGSGMIGLQEMLLQSVDDKIYLFPAWPAHLDVHFKLHAPGQTVVEVSLKNGKLTGLQVWPEKRSKDVVVMLPPHQ